MPEVGIDQITEIVENTSYLTWDVIAILAVIVLALVFAYTVGKQSVISFLVAAYAASFAVIFSPHILELSERISIDEWLAKTVVYLVLFILIFWIVKTNGFFEPYVVPTGHEIATFTIASVGLLLAVTATFIDSDLMATFSPWTRMIFDSEISLTIWSLVPVGSLLVLRGDT